MRLNVYSIYDTAAAMYTRPFFMQTDGQAIRAFTDLSINGESDIGKHPEDYALFCLGRFDDNSGELEPLVRKCLLTALEAVASVRKVDRGNLDLFDKSLHKVGGTN